MKRKIITLCGSTRFKEEFEDVQRFLTLQGNIVLSVGLFSHAEENSEEWMNNGVKKMLDDIHLSKIDMSDAIFVINKDGYIGESTAREIEYAKENRKEIIYMDEGAETNRRVLEYLAHIVSSECEKHSYRFDNLEEQDINYTIQIDEDTAIDVFSPIGDNQLHGSYRKKVDLVSIEIDTKKVEEN